MDRLDYVQCIVAFVLGDAVNDMSDVSNRLVGDDDQRTNESWPISTLPGGWRQKSIQSGPHQKCGRLFGLQLLWRSPTRDHRLDDLF